MTETPLDLLRQAETYLTATHQHAARHDVLGEDLTCGGCQLQQRITATLAGPMTDTPAARPAVDDLRERIAETLALHHQGPASDGRGWYRDKEQQQTFLGHADAVLAVLPDPTDRAAVDRVRHLVDRYQQWHEGGWAPRDAALVAQEFRDALDGHEPRHTADETQQGGDQ